MVWAGWLNESSWGQVSSGWGSRDIPTPALRGQVRSGAKDFPIKEASTRRPGPLGTPQGKQLGEWKAASLRPGGLGRRGEAKTWGEGRRGRGERAQGGQQERRRERGRGK